MTAAEITYDYLVESGNLLGYTDHVQHFKKLFSLMNVRGFLECGCGYSTKYFIDNCESVTSIEFVNNGFGDEWMQKCKEMYKDCPNWKGTVSEATDEIYKASAYQPAQSKDYSLIDATYIEDLRKVLNDIGASDFDVAFVDSGIYLRGDLAELLLQAKIAIVVAHDYSNTQIYPYGWDKIKSTEGYTQIIIPYGQTTCFWISNELSEVIAGMEEYKK